MVSPKRGHVRKKEMRDQYRLRRAEMRESWHQSAVGRRRPRRERGDRIDNPAPQERNPPHQVETEVERHLLVSRTAGVEASAGIAQPFHEQPFDEAVNVFVGAIDKGRIGSAAFEDGLQRVLDLVGLCVGQDAGPAQRPCPGDAAGYIVLKQTAIELEGGTELEGGRVRLGVESSGPEGRN
jgi:hypothetical protein